MKTQEQWLEERGEEESRVARVRAVPVGRQLDHLLFESLGVVEALGASTARITALANCALFLSAHPERKEDFAQRLVDEVAPGTGVHFSAIELDRHGPGAVEDGADFICRLIQAPPDAIVRAIILSVPETK